VRWRRTADYRPNANGILLVTGRKPADGNRATGDSRKHLANGIGAGWPGATMASAIQQQATTARQQRQQ